MHMPIGLLDEMAEVIKRENREQRRAAAKRQAKGRHG